MMGNLESTFEGLLIVAAVLGAVGVGAALILAWPATLIMGAIGWYTGGWQGLAVGLAFAVVGGVLKISEDLEAKRNVQMRQTR